MDDSHGTGAAAGASGTNGGAAFNWASMAPVRAGASGFSAPAMRAAPAAASATQTTIVSLNMFPLMNLIASARRVGRPFRAPSLAPRTYFTWMTNFSSVPSAGSRFLLVSSFSSRQSFMLRFVWNTVSSVTGKIVTSVPPRSAP